MRPVNRFIVLVSAGLAVASPFVAGAMARRDVGESARGLGYLLLDWPILLIGHLPERVSSVVMTSGMIPILLYFGAYLLACQALRLLWRRVVRVARHAGARDRRAP